MNLFEEFFKIAQVFEQSGIQYAVIGGVALAFHDQPRLTRDIDLLISPEDFEGVKSALESLGYFESAKPWTFRNTSLTLHRFMKTEGEDHLLVDILFGREDRYQEITRNAHVENSEFGPVRVATRGDIIQLKKMRSSQQDQVDIRRLQNDPD